MELSHLWPPVYFFPSILRPLSTGKKSSSIYFFCQTYPFCCRITLGPCLSRILHWTFRWFCLQCSLIEAGRCVCMHRCPSGADVVCRSTSTRPPFVFTTPPFPPPLWCSASSRTHWDSTHLPSDTTLSALKVWFPAPVYARYEYKGPSTAQVRFTYVTCASLATAPLGCYQAWYRWLLCGSCLSPRS